MTEPGEQDEAERLAKARWVCRWKNVYPSRVKAKRAAKLYASKGWRKNRHADKQTPYRCTVCGQWHLTTNVDWNATGKKK